VTAFATRIVVLNTLEIIMQMAFYHH